ncbi:hypothetical protein VP1G_05168 [Cytospora mali]|uniref:Flavin-nucleotide-binding protein n=1 Tax=Cytospora mali TaxID=578113 RepID=A0A194V1N0_CYTMA|nr:hypothetical protein VP1G_05168 [Valsa mali var. pyri (nom. inval.)]
MSSEETQFYPKTADSAINRHKERGHYDVETIHSIINSTPVAHVSFIPDPSDPKPVVLPMIARAGTFPGDTESSVFIHGYISTRLFRPQTGRSEPATRDHDEGLPVCIAATKIDSLVLALTPFNHSYDYRSAVVHGTATLLDPGTKSDPRNREEIIYAMKLITDGMVPGRWDNSRTPLEESEIVSTRILKVRIDSASAKIRNSGVKDDAKDLKNDETTGRVWTGVIPYVEVLGEPKPAETNKLAQVPEYISGYVKEYNEKVQVAGMGGLIGRVLGSLFGR